MSKQDLIAVRDMFQSLLDNYQVMDTAMTTYKTAMVQLNNVIETPEPAPITVKEPVVGTADVVAGVLAGLGDLSANISTAVLASVQPPLTALADKVTALTPPPPLQPQLLAPTADQLAAAQAVIAAAAAAAAAPQPAEAAAAT